MFDWMVWTTPVAVFFSVIALMLIGMTVWEIKSPTTLRKGFLPMATTRGDRLFIGLLSAAYINLAFVGLAGRIAEWLSLEQEPSIWISFVLSMGVLALVMRRAEPGPLFFDVRPGAAPGPWRCQPQIGAAIPQLNHRGDKR
jgi:predicted small integral membrane protein